MLDLSTFQPGLYSETHLRQLINQRSRLGSHQTATVFIRSDPSDYLQFKNPEYNLIGPFFESIQRFIVEIVVYFRMA